MAEERIEIKDFRATVHFRDRNMPDRFTYHDTEEEAASQIRQFANQFL